MSYFSARPDLSRETPPSNSAGKADTTNLTGKVEIDLTSDDDGRPANMNYRSPITTGTSKSSTPKPKYNFPAPPNVVDLCDDDEPITTWKFGSQPPHPRSHGVTFRETSAHGSVNRLYQIPGSIAGQSRSIEGPQNAPSPFTAPWQLGNSRPSSSNRESPNPLKEIFTKTKAGSASQSSKSGDHRSTEKLEGLSTQLKSNFGSISDDRSPLELPKTSSADTTMMQLAASVSNNTHQGATQSRQLSNGPSPVKRLASSANGEGISNESATPASATSVEVPTVTPVATKRWTCENCAEERIGCDGEIPCSNCTEPGLPCVYPGRPVVVPTRAKATQIMSLKEPFSSSKRLSLSMKLYSLDGTDGRPSEANSAEGPRANIAAATPFRKEQPRVQSAVAGGRQRTPIPLEIADIEALVKDYEIQMRSHRAYILRPALRQARLDTRKSGQPLGNSSVDPFAALVGKSLPILEDQAAESTNGSKLQVQTKTYTKAGSSGGKWKSSSIPVKNFEVDAVALPKYRSIGRLPSTILVRNYHTLKYLPYFPENEYGDETQKKNYEELIHRYEGDLPQLTVQRKCKELMDLWRPWVDKMLRELQVSFIDICYYLLHVDSSRPDIELSDSALAAWMSGAREPCPTCDHVDLVEDSVDRAMQSQPSPEPQNIALAGLLCHAFRNVAQVNLWHFASGSPVLRQLTSEQSLNEDRAKHHVANVLCLVCFRHYCPTHGAFKEDETEGHESHDVSIDDLELDNNFRQNVSLPIEDKNGLNTHKCGIFCGDTDLPLANLFGRQADGNVGGSTRGQELFDGSYRDDEDCGPNCFYLVKNRPQDPATIKDIGKDQLSWLNKLSSDQVELFKAMMPNFMNTKRGPCMVAAALEGVSCLDVFYYVVHETNAIPHDENQITEVKSSKMNAKNRPDLSRHDFSMTHLLDFRPAFVPCSHDGPCQGNADCSCNRNKIVCEHFCGCDMSCKRRYQGCTCIAAGKDCCTSDKCQCYQTNRECDPYLCGHCGVAETLDPVNRYDDQAQKGRCKNNRLQIGIPKRTVKGPSEVQGWGLFAGEDIAAPDYIGEYKGEVVSNQESDRRGAIYHNLGQEYLFVVNHDQEIDASISGNKMRFMNDSQLPENINVEAKKMLCNGVQRIMLYAQKDIKAGQELLYNYNYPHSVVKKFWERGEGPTAKPGATATRKGSSAQQNRQAGRFAKTSNVQERGAGRKTTGQEIEPGTSQFPVANRRKRKRLGAESSFGGEASSDATDSSKPVGRKAGSSLDEKTVIEASDESDFDADAVSEEQSGSEDEEEAEETSESEEEVQLTRDGKPRQRRINPGDRRLGPKGPKARRAMMEKKKRGGARPGAGAPKKGGVPKWR